VTGDAAGQGSFAVLPAPNRLKVPAAARAVARRTRDAFLER